MNRDEIIAANPLPDFLRRRGVHLVPAGENFVTHVCPGGLHRKGHNCVSVDSEKNVWHCNDHGRGGSVVDWLMFTKKISAADALRELAGGRNGQVKKEKGAIAATYDYVDENGELLFQCVRFDPKDFRQRRKAKPDDPPEKIRDGWVWNLKGVRRVLYRLPEVVKAQTVCVAEGEKDADNVSSLGFTATTNPMGAGKWRDGYSETLRGKNVLVFGDVGDPDQKGEKHTAQVIQSLSGKARSVKHITLPEGFHDVSDYIASFPSLDEAKAAVTQLIDEQPAVTPLGEQPRVAKVDPPQTPVTVEEWRTSIEANFKGLLRAAEISGSVMTQLLLNDVANPFALVLLDVPSSGKTITTNFFDVPQLSYTTDFFTPASLVSHATNVAREKLGDLDMLPRIRYKTLIVRDLAPIFGTREDDLLEMIGRLTRALDGEGLETDSGAHGQRGYKGDYLFMLLAGSTPLSPRVYKVLGTLGSRLFFISFIPKARVTRI